MRERDRISARQHQQELAEQAEREREERELHIREAAAQLEKNYLELNEVYKERLTGNVPDPDRFIDPQVGPDVRMTLKDAQSFTAKQWDLFVGQHPEIYVSSALLDLLDSYFAKEQIRIVTADMFAKLIERFAACGLLLPERPAPEPESLPVHDTPEVIPEAPTGPQMHEGVDISTGLARTYSDREVRNMSADTYRRAFLVSGESLRLPNVGPGPKGLQW